MIASVLEKRYQAIPQVTWILLFFSFLEAAAGGFSYYISLYLSTNTTMNASQIGVVGSLMGIGGLSGAIAGGVVGDRVKPQLIIFLSLLIAGLSFLLLPVSSAVISTGICVFFMGAASTTFLTSNGALILKSVPQDDRSLKEVRSLRAWFENAGNTTSLLLIMFVAGQAYKGIFTLVGAVFVLFALSTFKYLTKINTYKYIESSVDNNYKPLGRDFVAAFICVFIIGLLFAQQRIILPMFLKYQFSQMFWVGFFLFLDPLLVMIFQMKVFKKTEKYDPWLVMIFGAGLLAVGQFFLGFIDSGTILGIILLITLLTSWTFGEMMFMPVSEVVCYQDARSDKKVLSIGGWRVAYASGHIIGPIVSGNLLYNYGYSSNWIYSLIIGCLVCLLCYSRYLKRQ